MKHISDNPDIESIDRTLRFYISLCGTGKSYKMFRDAIKSKQNVLIVCANIMHSYAVYQDLLKYIDNERKEGRLTQSWNVSLYKEQNGPIEIDGPRNIFIVNILSLDRIAQPELIGVFIVDELVKVVETL